MKVEKEATAVFQEVVIDPNDEGVSFVVWGQDAHQSLHWSDS